MTPKVPKFPRMPHIPWSPGGTRDDRRLSDASALLGRSLVATRKMDGSNLCFVRDAVYARSHGGAPQHPSFDMAKARHAELRHLIPDGVSVFGEWMYAAKSISYDCLADYFLAFAVRVDDAALVARHYPASKVAGVVLREASTVDLGPCWLSWGGVEAVALALDVPTVPVLARDIRADTEAELRRAVDALLEPGQEGVVLRVAAGFPDADFPRSVAKWVRKGHVTTMDEHWSKGPFERNKLAGSR